MMSIKTNRKTTEVQVNNVLYVAIATGKSQVSVDSEGEGLHSVTRHVLDGGEDL